MFGYVRFKITTERCEEPDITKTTPRKIFASSDLATDPSAGLNYGGLIAQGFCGPFFSIVLGVILEQLMKNENLAVNCGTRKKNGYGYVWRENS